MTQYNPIIKKTLMVLFTVLATQHAGAQSVNQWRGDESGSDWDDRYKWNLRHPPTGQEAAHFRENNSLIRVNKTVNLDNGIYLYGQELTLQGDGNINLDNPVPHQRTVNIPASATGFANMTLNDTLAIKGRVALSAKAFGTSASKGSITLKDRTSVSGALSIGNAGSGTGQVYVKDNSTYSINGLELQTKADNGGSAEIHILGGTVNIETEENPFDVFLEDPSRKLIVGDAGTLRIETDLPGSEKKEVLKAMIIQNRLIAAPGCRLTLPVIQDKMVIIRAEDERNTSSLRSTEDLLAAIDKIQVIDKTNDSGGGQPAMEELMKQVLLGNTGGAAEPGTPDTAAAVAKTATQSDNSGKRLAGYIVFFGAALLVLRRADSE